jgi:hypothetical protein
MRIGWQWIVSFYAAWDEFHRPRLAKALGCEPKAIKVPLLGDLRCLRNDIVHNRGVASPEWAGKCEFLAHWVRIGEPIAVHGEQINEFVRCFPWDALGGEKPALPRFGSSAAVPEMEDRYHEQP